MTRKIATLNVKPVYREAREAATTTQWLVVLVLSFLMACWVTNSGYFLFVAICVTAAMTFSSMRSLSLTEQADKTLYGDLERRGLSGARRVSNAILTAQFDDQNVWVYLIAEGRTHIGVWVEERHT